MNENVRISVPHRTVVIRKVDLDTCLTGFLLGVSGRSKVRFARDGATEAELADRSVLCIEAGGSGSVERGNFDHHDPAVDLPPACVQAWVAVGKPDAMRTLVDYVAAVDLAVPVCRGQQPSLSAIFSGMRLTVAGVCEQFESGLRMLADFAETGIDPAGPVLSAGVYEAFLLAREREAERLRCARHAVIDAGSVGDFRVGYLRTNAIGALGLLYRDGFDIAIAHADRFDPSGEGKFTIGVKPGVPVKLAGLLGRLAVHEKGWGGPAHGTIIGSPAQGTALPPAFVIHTVKQYVGAVPGREA